MPTFREDLHLGHKVPTVETDDIVDKSITGNKLADRIIDWFHIIAKAIRNEHIDDGAVDTRTLADESVTTPKIADKAVTPEKLSDRIVPEVIDPLLKPLKDKDADLQNQIDSFNEHGMSVSNVFGDDTHIGISQKTLTEAINKIWSKFEDITGEVYTGFNMVVTPEYFIGEDGCKLTITASSENTAGIFEKLAFFWNSEQEPFFFAENIPGIDAMEVDVPEEKVINDKVIIRCEAQILGMPYVEQKAVTHYDSFFLGAGNDYHDMMVSDEWNPEYAISARHHMRGAHDVEVGDGEHIIIVLGDSLASGFIRADINGVEIGFNETTVVVDGNTYKVFTSENTYQAGTYNIDING